MWLGGEIKPPGEAVFSPGKMCFSFFKIKMRKERGKVLITGKLWGLCRRHRTLRTRAGNSTASPGSWHGSAAYWVQRHSSPSSLKAFSPSPPLTLRDEAPASPPPEASSASPGWMRTRAGTIPCAFLISPRILLTAVGSPRLAHSACPDPRPAQTDGTETVLPLARRPL